MCLYPLHLSEMAFTVKMKIMNGLGICSFSYSKIISLLAKSGTKTEKHFAPLQIFAFIWKMNAKIYGLTLSFRLDGCAGF